VQTARRLLAEGYERLKRRHENGALGAEMSAALSDLRDEVLLGLYASALADLGLAGADALSGELALVAHGGYGRRDVAPFSDVDVMVLCAGGVQAGPLVERLLCDVFDAGLVLGHSVRTVEEACQLSCQDATICSSLLESRLLTGNEALFHRFEEQFRRRVHRRSRHLLAEVQKARDEERMKFGETVYLLEPNIKRSRGGLRDIQLLRWIGAIRYGARDPAELAREGHLSDEDLELLRAASEFLLRLRNEMHFHAGRSEDVLGRAEQLRIAELLGYNPMAGMLPVEQFMRDYFRHTDQVSHVVGRFQAKAASSRHSVFLASLVGHRLADGFVVGAGQLIAGRKALERIRAGLPGVMELVELSNLYDVGIAPQTWDVVRREVARFPDGPPSPEACRRFLALLERPNRLGELLRMLHEIGILERFLPGYAHARGLLQFNQYHKYTVDEHSLRAVEHAVGLYADTSPFGRVYRAIVHKRTLHLALLMHDLGKGYAEDHSELGARMVRETAPRLGLDDDETATLEFLVQKHLVMNHLAFRRDTSDEQLLVRFAVEVGSPEWLQMLFVITAADLAAVGPDAWTSWKAEVLVDLYHRTMQHLAGESPSTSREEFLESRRDLVRTFLGPEGEYPWTRRQIDSLPVAYLHAVDPHQIAADLRLLAGLKSGEVNAQGHYLPETGAVQFTVGTQEHVTPGIFHRLTGALTSQGLEILSAQINTLADGLVLDRFWVYDPDFAGEPPPDRLEAIRLALVASLSTEAKPPSFRRVWTMGGQKRPTNAAPPRVRIDNATSDQYTIVDVFALDRRGLLYTITRTLFELGCSVWRAKIGTYLDQVVDVFYVTDQSGKKIEAPARHHEIRNRLLEVIEALEKDGAGARS
jgi:[protein-PII] uridylyltransferase